ncbi:phage holin family protein [Chloroherpeton thalassium]|nr:phage holin family protein [Chloroherpeton thalassium]
MPQPKKQPSQSSNATERTHTQSSKKHVSDLIEDTISGTYSDLIDILSAKIEIAKLEVSEQLADIIANVVILIILLSGALYLSVSIAIFIGDLTGYPWLGYLIISGSIFTLVFILTKLKPDWLKSKIQTFILSSQTKYSRSLLEKHDSEKA